MSNHLGNVLTVINDIKVPYLDGSDVAYYATIVSTADYSPFGVQLDGRTVSAESYRYGFNGMEKDDEMKGSGNSYDFGAMILDPRLGRWLTIDPEHRKQAAWSPYKAFYDCPIVFIDPNGKTEFQVTMFIRAGETRGIAHVTTNEKVMTDGKRIMVRSSWGSSYHYEQNYYDYYSYTVHSLHEDGSTTTENWIEIMYDYGPRVSTLVWDLGGMTTLRPDGTTMKHTDPQRDYGVKRSFGFDIKGTGGGPVAKDFSDRVFGSADKELIDHLFKKPKFQSKWTYTKGKGSWESMTNADAAAWAKWLKDALDQGGKLGKIVNAIVDETKVSETGSGTEQTNQTSNVETSETIPHGYELVTVVGYSQVTGAKTITRYHQTKESIKKNEAPNSSNSITRLNI